jgi:hypothetical protein
VRRLNRTSTGRTIRALKATGKLETVDEAIVGLARATADLLDEAIDDAGQPAYARAALGRLHLAALLALTGKDGGDADAGLNEVIAALSAPLGYAPIGSPEPGS